MPELPEVETARRIIERELTGRTVSAVEVRLPKMLRDSPMPTLNPLIGRAIHAARRRAKVLVVDFDGGLSLLIHLKLAGQVAVFRPDGRRHVAGHPIPKPDGAYPHKTTHVHFTFDDGSIWYLSDVRQFGWLRLMPSEDVDGTLAAFNFGPEAVGPDRITEETLRARLARRSIPVKTALLDQSVLAGLGNIYVDEALHRARIHPATPAHALTAAQVHDLWQAAAWALERGIEQGGAKIVHSRAYPIDGFPAAHARQGDPCSGCGAPIEKIRVGSRGTYLCPACQPMVPTGGSPTRD